jgi:hypothetical protein
MGCGEPQTVRLERLPLALGEVDFPSLRVHFTKWEQGFPLSDFGALRRRREAREPLG